MSVSWGQSFILEDEQVLETDGGDGSTTMSTLLTLNCMLKGAKLLTFIYILPQFFRKG